MTEDLLTTRQAASLLGVGTTSIKRWANAGLLQCVRTPGGHRRFPRAAVEALVGRLPDTAPVRAGRIPEWIALLTGKATARHVAEALAAERRRHDAWGAVAKVVGQVLEELGRGWARGEISVIDEHIASERLRRGLARCVEDVRVPPRVPACFLMTAENDEHSLGLSLVEVCLRESGWRAIWSGSRTPVHFACEFIATSNASMAAVSASQYSRDAAFLADQAHRLGQVCQARGIPLVLGGKGLWPETPAYGHRLHCCSELQVLLGDLGSG